MVAITSWGSRKNWGIDYFLRFLPKQKKIKRTIIEKIDTIELLKLYIQTFHNIALYFKHFLAKVLNKFP